MANTGFKTARKARWVLNNYSNDELEQLQNLDCRYIIFSKEIAPTTQTPHLQGFVVFHKKMSLKQLKLINPRICWLNCDASQESNINYVTKTETKADPLFIFEKGTKPQQGKRTDLETIARHIHEGMELKQIAEQYPGTYIRNYRGIANYQALFIEDYEHTDVRGIWIYGPPGVGKSFNARKFLEARCPNGFYVKAQNKWWDGYAGETGVLLDDLDSNVLSHYLKIWADRYACRGEIKGGSVKLRHKYFVVTSNHSIKSLFTTDNGKTHDPGWCETPLKLAIARRFEEIYVPKYTETIEELMTIK